MVAVLLVALATGAVAQGGQPLRKSDLVRLLTGTAFSQAEIAALVRRNCIAFRPSERDRADLRALGADAEIMSGVETCARRTAPTGSVRVVTAQSRVTAEAGTDATITVRLVRGAQPQSGQTIVLKGSGAIPGGPTQDVQAITDNRGEASFTIPAGTAVAAYRLTAVPASGAAGAGAGIELRTVAGRPVLARIRPARVEFSGAPGERQQVTVEVRDAYGNPITQQVVGVQPTSVEMGAASQRRVSDGQGQATFEIARADFRRGGEMQVFVRGERLTSFLVALKSAPLSADRTRFVAGADQHGVAGTRFAQPLMLEVRDTTGAPVRGERVVFTAANGAVTPDTGVTNFSGQVRVVVTAGKRAGATGVTAAVGGIRKDVSLPVDPGAAAELVIERNGAPVSGTQLINSKQPVEFRVTGRDAYGNVTPLADLQAAPADSRVLQVSGVGADPAGRGSVTLEARRSGTTAVEFTASGLRETVATQVVLPRAGVWAGGVRMSWAGFNYDFSQVPNVQGRSGFRAEFFGGRALTSALRLELVVGLGGLKADTGALNVSVELMQSYLKAVYALRPGAAVVPVISFGAGGYRIRSDDPGEVVYHTSLFWMTGVGADFALSPKLIGEIRIETHQLNEVSSPYGSGHVGSLTVVEGGVRLTP